MSGKLSKVIFIIIAFVSVNGLTEAYDGKVHSKINHDVEILARTDTAIDARVPQNAGLIKPGYGGIRLRTVLDSGEVIFSNPTAFFSAGRWDCQKCRLCR